MHLTVTKADLVKDLGIIIDAVERRPTIPILANVRMDALPSAFLLSGTDLEQGLRMAIPAEIQQPGSLTVPAKKLYDYIRLLPDGFIDLKSADNDRLNVTAGRSKMRIAGMDIENFPDIPVAPEAAVQLPADAVGRLIRRVQFAISREESRFTLVGALLDLSPGRMRMVATDGHRLSLAEADVPGLDPVALNNRKPLIHVNGLKLLAKLIDVAPAGSMLGLAADENHIYASVGHRALVMKRMSGNFPDYERVLPKEGTGAVDVSIKDFSAALSRIALVTNERSRDVALVINGEQVSMSSSGNSEAEGVETVAAQAFSGNEVTIRLSADYLRDALAVCESSSVRLSYTDDRSAITVTPTSGRLGEAFRCVIMPMRA